MSQKGNLNIINEDGEIIGVDSRENIHQKGLLHREVHVWFYTPEGEIIFQHRSKNTETFPNLLDSTVGGHVEIGEDYEDAALKETEEETGVKIKKEDLKLIKFFRSNSFDPVTSRTNNALRAIYAYCFKNDIKTLKLENEKGAGFEIWPFEKILNASEEDKKKIIPATTQELTLSGWEEIIKHKNFMV